MKGEVGRCYARVAFWKPSEGFRKLIPTGILPPKGCLDAKMARRLGYFGPGKRALAGSKRVELGGDSVFSGHEGRSWSTLSGVLLFAGLRKAPGG